jgi:hypothetical protein
VNPVPAFDLVHGQVAQMITSGERLGLPKVECRDQEKCVLHENLLHLTGELARRELYSGNTGKIRRCFSLFVDTPDVLLDPISYFNAR